MIIFHALQKSDTKFLVDLFNEQFTYDPITEEQLTEKIFQEEHFDSDLNITVKYHNSLAGFASGFVREQDGKLTGWIKLIATADQKKMGPVLLETFDKMETKLREKGARSIRFFDSFPNYFIPGIDPRYTSLITLLQMRGYERRRDNVQMIARLDQNFATQKQEELIEKKYNIVIKRATHHDTARLSDLINLEFPLWKQEIEFAFQKKTIPLHIAIKDKKVVAFSNHSCNNIGTGWFGPMGTTREAQGKGLGEILLKRCLQDLKDTGFKEAIIPWVGPIGFYFTKVGAEVDRVFWNYIKDFS
ncbi:MAG: GNAT family N-acetyltransferase [Candidatus Marinimicrobia bacterium]|nr:GNAT family N-acetyltransferase [Candidatus Neomarinimicrobiota bacterium]